MKYLCRLIILLIFITSSSYSDIASSSFTLDEDGWSSGKWSTATSNNGLSENDPYLLIDAISQAPRRGVILYNTDNEWTGNLIQKNATSIDFDVRNTSQYSYDAYMRVAFGDVFNPMGGTWFVSKEPIFVPALSSWTNISLPILEGDLEKAGSADVNGSAGPLTYQEVMSDTFVIRIISNPANRNATTDNFYGDVYIDNIQMIPEPTTISMVGLSMISILLFKKDKFS